MGNLNDKQFFDDVKVLGASLEKLEILFPQMREQLIPLSNTGITPRTFIHWRNIGIIDYTETTNETRAWVRLNLFQYLWLKVCVAMRDFGLPLPLIIKAKQEYFKDFFEGINDIDVIEFKKFLSEESNLSQEQIDAQMRTLEYIKESFPYLPDEDKFFYTSFALFIARILFFNDYVTLIIINNEGMFNFGFLTMQTLDNLKNFTSEFHTQIHLSIPLRRFLEEFIDKPKNRKFLNSFGLINQSEKRVLDAIRDKSFNEIIIRFGKDREDMIIEGMSDGDIMDSKVKEVQRILGIKEYSEITLKFRNDKHIYVKNKTRIND